MGEKKRKRGEEKLVWRAAKNTGKKKTRLFSLARTLLSFQSSHLGGLRLERLAGLVGLAGLLEALDRLQGLACGLNVDLFVRWERGGGGGEREKKRKR